MPEAAHPLRGEGFDCEGGEITTQGIDFQNCASTGDVSGTLMGEAQRKGGQAGLGVTHSLRAEGFDASEDGTGRGTPIVPEVCAPLTTYPHADNEPQESKLIPEVANPLTARMHKGINSTLDEGRTALPVAFDTTQITSKANYSNPKPGDPCHPLAAGAHPPAVAFHNRQDPDISGDVTHPLGSMDNGMAVAFDLRGREGGAMPEGPHDTANMRAASGGSSRSYVAAPMAVRRLTPRECESLQGFPDDFTRIPWRGKDAENCPDGPRYKALGNSMATNAMAWIGRRIEMVEGIE